MAIVELVVDEVTSPTDRNSYLGQSDTSLTELEGSTDAAMQLLNEHQ